MITEEMKSEESLRLESGLRDGKSDFCAVQNHCRWVEG